MAVEFGKNDKNFISRSEEAYIASSNIADYKLPTKIGLWEEKFALQLEKMALIKKKRGRCETLTIRRNIMYENLHRESRLHEPNKYIHYGDPIHISTDELQTTMLGVQPCVLATIITERDIDVTLNLCHGCPVVASTFKEPVLRNVMKIIDPLNPNRVAERITYGKDIFICVHDSNSERKLYVQALVPTFDDFGGGNDHLILRLSECPDRYCKFKIIHMNPELRDFSYGDDIPSNTTVCIAHTVSNKYLVTENRYMPTFFGGEMEVSCYIYKDSKGRESPAGYWELAIEKQKQLIKKETN